MIGLIAWIRSFTYNADGSIAKNAGGAVFAAHPQPNLWELLATEARSLAESFDVVQLPPWTEGSGEGYAPFSLRNLNSNWGKQAELLAACGALKAAGVKVSADCVLRQMGGENGGPGVFTYPGGVGDTVASWFSNFGQPGETTPPFVAPDDVPDPSGDYPFGRVRSYQNCIPEGATTNDSLDAVQTVFNECPVDMARVDDTKGTYLHFVRLLVKLLHTMGIDCYGEFDSGNASELAWYTERLDYLLATEDYAAYWNSQRACNGYDARQFNPMSNPGYWRWNNGMAVGFMGNPDVCTSWSPTGGISQQTAFNLLLGYAANMCLPYKLFLVYAEDYYPASPDYPTGRGLKPFLDNLSWFARKFAFGTFEERYVDGDVWCYSRDGDGGKYGWSGGCLVAVNFNTWDARTITVQTMWSEGQSVHNYSMTGKDEYYRVGAGGKLTVTIPSNAFSAGQSYLLIAPSGVS